MVKTDRIKIMQIAPFGLPIKENLKYGGIERVVRDLDKQYSKKGYESSVVATGDSKISGTLYPTFEKGSWIAEETKKEGCRYKKNVKAHNENFETHCSIAFDWIKKIKPDIIHDHVGFIRSKVFQKGENFPPILTTLHGPLNKENMKRFEKLEELVKGKNVKFNAISESQKKKFNRVINVDYTILNAVDIEKYPYNSQGSGFVFHLGLISPAKGTDTAIEASKKLRKKIVIAGPIHQFVPEIKNFWENKIKSKIDIIYDKEIPIENIENFVSDFIDSDINSIYIGELDDKQKVEWFKRADAFYFPARWEEPFGLVMIESNACGTPVVAYDKGAVPEVIKHGKNGYVIKQGDFKSFLNMPQKLESYQEKDAESI